MFTGCSSGGNAIRHLSGRANKIVAGMLLLTGMLYLVFVEMSQAAWRSNNVQCFGCYSVD